MEKIRFVAPCLMGLESLVAGELTQMGALEVAAVNGKVYFSGGPELLARANLCSRYSERILVVLGQFKAQTFDQLFEGVKALPLERWIEADSAFPVKGWSLGSQLHSIPDCQAIVKKAAVERLKSVYHINWFDETGPIHQLQFSIHKDEVDLMLDTSGAGLHKRGYRPDANTAPIKETLAAAMAYLARVNTFTTLYDPFCGSGTLLIESALLAHNIAPGLRRNFAAERFAALPASVWQEERSRARDQVKRESEFVAYGSDVDARSLEIAQKNCKRAGVSSKVRLLEADIRDFAPETPRGTVLCNPPYGERMLEQREAEELYRVMGRVFPKREGYTYNVISPHPNFEKLFGRQADKRRKLYNGMINCQYHMYFRREASGAKQAVTQGGT